MRREVLEETGLTVSSFRFRGIVTFVSDRDPDEYMFLYTVDAWSGELTECDEGELAFIDCDRLYTLTLWEGDRIFLRLIREEDQAFFSLKLRYAADRLVEAVLDGVPLPTETEGV